GALGLRRARQASDRRQRHHQREHHPHRPPEGGPAPVCAPRSDHGSLSPSPEFFPLLLVDDLDFSLDLDSDLSTELLPSELPGRRRLIVPWKDSSSTRALPSPRVKLNRSPWRVSLSGTGNGELKPPLNMATDTVALVRSGMTTVTSPLWELNR